MAIQLQTYKCTYYKQTENEAAKGACAAVRVQEKYKLDST